MTNHAVVLHCLVRSPDARLRELAAQVGLTERATHKIVNDLVEEGYLTRRREGRRCHYEVHDEQPLRHRLHGAIPVGFVLSVLEKSPGDDDVVDLRDSAGERSRLEEVRRLAAEEARSLELLVGRRERLRQTLDRASRLLQAAGQEAATPD